MNPDRYPTRDAAKLAREDYALPSSKPLLRLFTLLGLLLLFAYTPACKSSKQAKTRSGEGGGSGSWRVLARIEDESIDETSGIAASRVNPGLFWIHNDSGDDPLIFAIDREGKTRAVLRIEGAKARDWEDIAVGPGPVSGRYYIYIGDIGNNKFSREQIIVYRLPEPQIESVRSSRKQPLRSEPADVIRLVYPDRPQDAEALMVHPQTADIYIATKTVAQTSVIYKLSATALTSGVNRLWRVGEVRIPNPFGALITGADISPDGRRVVLCDYGRGYELLAAGDSNSAFDEIWKQPATPISLGNREQGEAVCYRHDGHAILATSEGRRPPLIEIEIR